MHSAPTSRPVIQCADRTFASYVTARSIYLVRSRPITIGRVALSPSRRLTTTVRKLVAENVPIVDLRLEVFDGHEWNDTKSQVLIELERVPKVISLLEKAMRKLD